MPALGPVAALRATVRTYAAGALVGVALYPRLWPLAVYVVLGSFVIDRTLARLDRSEELGQSRR